MASAAPEEFTGGGEDLSMGVDASNALRVKLGLKPLREGKSKKEEEIEKRSEEAADADKQAEREVEIETKLEKMKNKRLLRTEMQGPSVAEKLKESGGMAATAGFADWVSHTRTLDKDRELAKKREAELEAQDKQGDEYTSADLAGMSVAHDVGDMRDGETVIMTLKDSSILQEEDGDVAMNEEEDKMENVMMVEDQRTKQRLDTKKKKAFARYQDALAAEESGAMDGGAVLPHYDDIDPVTGEARKKEASSASFTLGEQGAEMDAKRAKLEAIKAKLAKGTGGVRTGAVAQSVDVVMQQATAAATDYYSEKEMTQFAKPKEKKKRRKVRKKKKGSIADELEPLEDQGDDDRGSRKDAAKARRDTDEDATAAASKKRGYENALAKADEKARQMAADADGDGGPAGLILDEEEDAEMKKALDRARRLKSKTDAGMSTGLAGVKAQVDAAKAKSEADAAAGGDDGGEELEDLEFTVTGEFCKAISTDHLRKKRKATETAAGEDNDDDDDSDEEGGAGGAAAASESGTRETGGWASDKKKKQKVDEGAEGDESDEEVGALDAEPMAASGMAAALALARSKGMLREAEQTKSFGRSNDIKVQRTQEADEKKKEAQLREEAAKEAAKNGGRGGSGRDDRGRDSRGGRDASKPAAAGRGMGPPVPRARQGNLDDVARIDEMMKAKAATREIHYADENGRKLTTKQAFRQLAHQFHGITPGKKALEKQMRIEAEANAMQEMSVVDTPLNSSVAMQKEQETTGKAFINIDAKKVSEKEMKKLKKRAARAAEKAAKGPRKAPKDWTPKG